MATQLAEQADAPEVADIQQDNDQQAPERDFEAEAREHGWTPKDDFKGDPSRWVDAETFIKRADEVMPLLRKQNQGLKSEITELKRMVRKLTKAEQGAYDNALADLKAKAEAAVESGDLDAYRKVDGQIEKLREEAEADLSEAHGENPDRVFIAFRKENAWYDRGNLKGATEVELEARRYADLLADEWAAEGLTKELSPSEFFARIAQETEEKFPLLKARKTRDKPASPVAGVTRGNPNPGAKTGANLPADAKEHAERYMRMGIFKVKTKQEAYDLFAKSYTGPWS